MNRTGKYTIALSIVRRLCSSGHTAVFAGGFVRDMLLENASDSDIDIATSATPQQIAGLFSRVQGVGEHFGVMLVIEQGIAFEVATFRTDVGARDGRHPESVVFSTPHLDAQRRDFTINGLFYDPLADTVLDYVGGEKDLRKGIIRAIGDPDMRFKEDYLRLLRAIRFAARFDFAIASHTWDALCAHAEGIRTIASERIFQELNKMFCGPCAQKALQQLSSCGLCAIVLPEVEALKGVEQPANFHPEGDVFEHTVKALSFLHEPSPILAWSTVLHDIGKPATQSRKSGEDRIRFNNHHRVGARLAMQILKRLHSSRSLAEGVYECIDKHMDFMNVGKMRLSTLKRFLARPTFDDELELHRIDCLASHGNLDNYEFLQKKRCELAQKQVQPEPLLTGKDLISLGLTPGPHFGRILGAAYDLQLEEKLSTAEEARKWAEKNKEAFENGNL
jgi:poly(A) polymerase